MEVKMFMIVIGLMAFGAVSGTTTKSVTNEEEQTTTILRPETSGLKWLHLKQGDIFAQIEVAGDGQSEYYAFKGIPYARPPVGELRFKDPVAAGPWTEPRNGSFVAPVCPQIDEEVFLATNASVGQEDCLYLNVFTSNPHNLPMPVMVFIHGGGFNIGGIDIYPGEPLVTRNVVLVTIQYRLSTLGFLSTEDSIIPGNLGLKDQSLALQWVQENIREFGGDPLRVTVFGESSGGASTHFHVLSPLSQGLFHRAIMQSGTSLCHWAIGQHHRDVAMKVGRKFNCPGLDSSSDSVRSSQLLSCLQKVSANELTLAIKDFQIWGPIPSVMMPRVDGVFLPDHPAKLLKEGNYNPVDLISGITRDERASLVKKIFNDPDVVEGLRKNWASIGPLILDFVEEVDDNPEYLARRSFYHYLGNNPLNANTIDEFQELLSDRHFRMGHDEASQLHSRDAIFGKKIYRYELHHRGQHSLADLVNGTIGDTSGVSHGDDLMYLFNSTGYPLASLERDSDLFVSDIMLTLWTNFAATGNPTPTQSLGFRWTPMSGSDYSYLAITLAPWMVEDHRNKVREFWRNLPTHQNKILYPDLFAGNQ